LATHVQNLPAPSLRRRNFRRTKTLIAGVAVTLGISLVGSLPAHAAPPPPPTTPSNSSDAKTAWENSSHQAEIASEQVNGAREAQTKAEQAARRAASDLTSAAARATASQQASTAAIAAVASYQRKLDAFANASFRGARLSQFSVMLTATSANDFLDESTVVSRVAQDTQKTLTSAIAAKNTAARARTDADAAEAAAAAAKTKADQAVATADVSTLTAKRKKAELDAAVVIYKSLYDKLTVQEKAAAAAAAEKIRQESIRAAAAVQAQSQAAAAAAKQNAVSSSSSSSSSSSAASAPAVANNKVQAGSSSSSSTPASTTSTSSGASSVSGGDAAGNAAAALALTKVGFSYVYGATGPDSFDCSGLTSWAWAQQGISIPRASYEQANLPEVPLSQLQPGDLVTYYSPVSHVAIYVGNGMVVSAADEQLGVVLRTVDRAGPDATGHRVPRG
jgi:cell wall-associated NlpC family hydrolase